MSSVPSTAVCSQGSVQLQSHQISQTWPELQHRGTKTIFQQELMCQSHGAVECLNSPCALTLQGDCGYRTCIKQLRREVSRGPRAAAEKAFGTVLHSFGILPCPSPGFWTRSSIAYGKPRAALEGKVTSCMLGKADQRILAGVSRALSLG